jgi:biopolymer transport protein ExbD
MKSVLEVCLVTFAVSCVAAAQAKPALQPGIHVEMPVSVHAIEMPAADKEDATVVTLTADGQAFVGAEPIDISALSSINARIVYVKADAQIQYQKIVTLFDALRGRSVVLLTAPAAAADSAKRVPPYGVKVTVSGQ